METGKPIDIDELVLDPGRHYARPSDVLDDARLDVAGKRRVLRSWVVDAKRLAEAEAENMAGGEPDFLREAKLALLRLDG